MNRRFKRSFAVILCVALAACMFTACSNISVPKRYQYDDLTKYIKLAEYKGIEYSKSLEATDKEVQDRIDSDLEAAKGRKELKSGTIKNDSVVNIGYVGSVDGVEFEGGSTESADLDIAHSNYIDGFAEALVGHNVGENFDINVTFPENYGSADLAGKDAVFNITVNCIYEDVVPEYNDEFVKNNTDYKNVAEYEKGIRKEITAAKKSDADVYYRSEVFDKIFEASEVIEYPEAELAESGEEVCKTELILYQIARLEGIELTDSDYSDYLDKLLDNAGITAKEFEEEQGYTIEQYAAQNNLFTALMYERVMDKVIGYSVAK